jgi:nicotinamidase-related amidase/type 1 glutamine amidotransferase
MGVSLLILGLAFKVPLPAADPAPLALQLRYQTESSPGSGCYHTLTRSEEWQPRQTAIIVCDMWDLHHCKNAVLRETEFAPRLNQVLQRARAQGVTIIHAPSDCMDFYADHPARRRAVETPKSASLPAEIGQWCRQIPAEERGVYPVDQSQGGEDDDPAEHAAWAAELTARGVNPRRPWIRQTPLVEIDAERDYVSDKGEEVWSILESRGISNVILTGVHTNMCVLGRPFGLRQMARNGKNVVLMRDLTDTMYDPRAWPYVSHFTGTDLIVAHIEKFVCPTITSDQFLGDKPFRFSGDHRPHVVIVMAEDEYRTEESLPKFALEHLGQDFRVSYVFGSDTDRGDIPGLEVVSEADLLLVSVRRRPIHPAQLDLIRRYVAAGKPVLGIRTASHAFSLRKDPAPEGTADWPEWDAQVFGGHYTNHYGNTLKSTVSVVPGAEKHPILKDVPASFAQGGSLYQTAPLATGATPLLEGRLDAEAKPAEPAAWIFIRADGGRSFYTSLGHVDDFAGPALPQLLKNALIWAAQPVGK